MKATRLVAILLALYAIYNTWIVVTFSMPLFLVCVVLQLLASGVNGRGRAGWCT